MLVTLGQSDGERKRIGGVACPDEREADETRSFSSGQRPETAPSRLDRTDRR